MSDGTKIEWTATRLPDGTLIPGATFNPWVGCQKISPACDHCYAEGWAKRAGHPELWTGERRKTSAAYWRQPEKWNAEAQRAGIRKKVFCASLADVFDNQVPEDWRTALWITIGQTPHLDWLLLTKRPQNISKMLPTHESWLEIAYGDWPWPNVWLGTTAEDQDRLAERAWHLAQIPARVRFLSYEPALGPLNVRKVENRWGTVWDALTGKILHATSGPANTGAIHQVICGGESGPGARPMHPDWARSLRDQCAGAGVPFFFKQWGEWAPTGQFCATPESFKPGLITKGHNVLHATRHIGDDGLAYGENLHRVGKKSAGALLDGLAIREFPEGI